MKKILTMIVCLCMIASLCACGTEQNGNGDELDVQAYQEFLDEMNSFYIRAVNARVVTREDGTKYLTADIINDSSHNISELVVAFATWDENGTPIYITTAENPENTQNLIEMTLDDVSISSGETWHSDKGLFIAESSYGVEYVTAIVTSCKMDQSQWTNTHYDTWKQAYINVLMESWKLETITTNSTDSDVSISDSETIDSTFTEFYTWLYGQDLSAFNADSEYQSDGYCALMCDIRNYRDDATDIVVAFAMWDSEGKPLVINTHAGNSAYIIETELADLTIEWKEVWTADRGLYITNDDSSVAYVEAIVISATVNGTVEENKMYDMWKEYFGGKSLTAEQLAEMKRIETSYTEWLSNSENIRFEEWANNVISGVE